MNEFLRRIKELEKRFLYIFLMSVSDLWNWISIRVLYECRSVQFSAMQCCASSALFIEQKLSLSHCYLNWKSCQKLKEFSKKLSFLRAFMQMLCRSQRDAETKKDA